MKVYSEMTLPKQECDRCGETLYGGSHYHCGNCTSQQVTSMLGHYLNGEFTCKPEEVIDASE